MQGPHEGTLSLINSGENSSYNVLTASTHEAYQYNWRKMRHNFFLMQPDGWVKWKQDFRPLPDNHTLVPKNFEGMPNNISLQIILSQNKFGQYQTFRDLNRNVQLPFISLEHTLPLPTWSKKERDTLCSLRGDINVFISEFSCAEWGFDKNDEDVEIIHHGIDTHTFNNDEASHGDGKILTVVNDWINRDLVCGWSIYQRVAKDLPVNPVGGTPNFSEPAKDIDDLVSKYKSASVFLNTSTISPVPTSLMEAMSCACPVVTTATCMIPEIVQDGVNGFCSNDEEYLREKVIWCLENPIEAKKIGLKGRETILQHFSLESHIEKWHRIFDKAIIDFKGI